MGQQIGKGFVECIEMDYDYFKRNYLRYTVKYHLWIKGWNASLEGHFMSIQTILMSFNFTSFWYHKP